MENKDFEKVIEILENTEDVWMEAIIKIVKDKEEVEKRRLLLRHFAENLRVNLKKRIYTSI